MYSHMTIMLQNFFLKQKNCGRSIKNVKNVKYIDRVSIFFNKFHLLHIAVLIFQKNVIANGY